MERRERGIDWMDLNDEKEDNEKDLLKERQQTEMTSVEK